MGEILSAEEVAVALEIAYATRDGWPRAEAVAASHEELRRCLAEVEAERDNLAMFHRDWYANDLPEMQRLAMWLHPDPNLPLPNLRNLANASIARAEAAEARLAKVEQVLDAERNYWQTRSHLARTRTEEVLAEYHLDLIDAALARAVLDTMSDTREQLITTLTRAGRCVSPPTDWAAEHLADAVLPVVAARLAEVEAEREAAARFGESTQDWLRRRLAEVEAERDDARMQNVEAWASIANLRSGLDAAERRLAEVEAALQEVDDCFMGYSLDDVIGRVERMRLIVRSVLPPVGSHDHPITRTERAEARLAEVEQALRELDAAAVEFGDGGNDLVIGARFALAVNRCRALLDKEQPDGE